MSRSAMTLAAVNVDVLRQGWDDAVSALAPDLPEVSAMLGARLEQAEREGRLDEASLLAIVDDVRAATARAGGADVARLLTRRLQRAVHEGSAGDAGSESVAADPATAELRDVEAEASAEPSAVETEAAQVDEDTSESTPAADDTVKSETAEAAPPEANGDGSRDGARRLRFMIFRQPARREEAPKAPEASPAPEAVPATDTS